jgi:prolipoprotein diacylglyceryltransferase
MNAFPPPRYVTQGVYRLVSHPIYAGAGAVCFGVSIVAGSSSGFWLVSPTLVLASVALVLGYEGLDLEARFGPARARPLLSLPPDDPGPPTLWERLALYPLVFPVWGGLVAAIAAAGPPAHAWPLTLPIDGAIPVQESAAIASVLMGPLVVLAPLAARARSDLRAFALPALLAMALIFLLQMGGPFVSPDGSRFPSFNAVWALLAADAWASRFSRRSAWRAAAILIVTGTVLAGRDTVINAGGSALVYLAVAHRARVWEALRGLAERVANSWSERRLGPVRVINHGGWAALSTFGGLCIVGTLIGPGHALSVFVAALAGMVCSALWAQIIEGSPALLRPYGWYGGVLGVTLGSLAAPLTGTSVWLLLSAYCVAGPWMQSAGRLRCLVQGCCHGREAPDALGIKYTHPRSRVCRLSDLGGRPVHPTPVYSILWNVVIALVVGRLWSLRAPMSFVGGVYLGLNGLGRFVEEAYRGEPQTPVYAGLRFYQWVALGTVVAGAAITALLTSDPAPAPAPSWTCVAVAALFGALTWFGTGVDFPESNRRFSRLS